ENRIRKHELTTIAKEDDRVRQIEAVKAQTGPVMLAYPTAPAVDALLSRAAAGLPEVDVTADDGVRHQLWVLADDAAIAALTRAVDALPALYIADGHHRSAAAERIGKARGREGSHSYFLAVLLPQTEMTILDYNRVLRDLNGRTPETLLAEVGGRYAVAPSEEAGRAPHAAEVGMALGGRWYRLTLRPELLKKAGDNPVARLPVTLLARNIIEPIFNVTDPRRDKRIDFVGGGRGLAELERLVASGQMAVAFALYPTQMTDLMAVADAREIMPPETTPFRPT